MTRSRQALRGVRIAAALWLLLAASAAHAACPCTIRGRVDPPRPGLEVRLFDLAGNLLSEPLERTDATGAYRVLVRVGSLGDLFFSSYLVRAVGPNGRVLFEAIVYGGDWIVESSDGADEVVFRPIPLN